MGIIGLLLCIRVMQVRLVLPHQYRAKELRDSFLRLSRCAMLQYKYLCTISQIRRTRFPFEKKSSVNKGFLDMLLYAVEPPPSSFSHLKSTMIKPYNITVTYVPVNDFDWSFTRTGPLPWNQTVWYNTLENSAQNEPLTFEKGHYLRYSQLCLCG